MPVFRRICLVAFIAISCSPAAGQPPAHPHPRPVASAASDAGAAQPTGLPSVELAAVPPGTYGPYVGVRPGSAVAVWAEIPGKGKSRRWYTVALGADSSPPAKPLALTDAPGQVGLVAVKPAGGPAKAAGAGKPAGLGQPGFVVVSTRRGFGSQQVEAMVLGVRGELSGGPTALAEPAGDVLWVDAVPTSRGTLALWAVQHGDRADLFDVELGAAGEMAGAVHKVLEGARAWQVVPVKGGAALAAVVADKGHSSAGPVDLLYLDLDGKAGKPLEVSKSPTAELDLDMTRVEGSLLLAWSDERDLEPRVYLASVDATGKLSHPPTPATERVGEQALVRLVRPFEDHGPAYIAWENLTELPEHGTAIKLAPVAADAKLGPSRGVLYMSAEDGSVPEMKATRGGVAALTLAPACRRGGDCDSAEKLPTFIEYDRNMRVVATEPARLSVLGGAGVSLAWGLTCRSRGCMALAALSKSPAPIYALDLTAHTGDWTPPGHQVTPPTPPYAASNAAVAEVPPLSDISATRLGDTTLAAWVTYFDPTTPYKRLKHPAPDGRYDPPRALLQVRAFPDGKPAGEAQTISLRARSLGGVSLAPGDPSNHDALLAWAAMDNKQPQVFLTRVGADGKKQVQHALTHAKGETSDVVAAYVGDGWLVGWVDERTGDPEVYVTKVNRALKPVAPEHRVTSVSGAATGLTMLRRGDHTLLAWSDARDGAEPGWADIYLSRINNADAKPLGPEQRLLATRPHSHSPVLAAFGKGAVVAWVEARPENPLASDSPGIRIGQLDENGAPVAPPIVIPGDGGSPTSVGLSCKEAMCGVVMSVDLGRRAVLQAFEWHPGDARPHLSRLTGLSGPAGESVFPVLLGTDLFFADETRQDSGRVRRLRIQWD